ncbi:hypothetical protein Clacol_010068 [Clathrus columnatus]|uniref:Uncharacterized protein n=1 Tax=Clathrus columnatus TaxID=1419009 RepID=A0AAV5AVB2_9AGAM|nr:hypothetical protein Clacol_010068 [Clathrus columnatus]
MAGVIITKSEKEPRDIQLARRPVQIASKNGIKSRDIQLARRPIQLTPKNGKEPRDLQLARRPVQIHAIKQDETNDSPQVIDVNDLQATETELEVKGDSFRNDLGDSDVGIDLGNDSGANTVPAKETGWILYKELHTFYDNIGVAIPFGVSVPKSTISEFGFRVFIAPIIVARK